MLPKISMAAIFGSLLIQSCLAGVIKRECPTEDPYPEDKFGPGPLDELLPLTDHQIAQTRILNPDAVFEATAPFADFAAQRVLGLGEARECLGNVTDSRAPGEEIGECCRELRNPGRVVTVRGSSAQLNCTDCPYLKPTCPIIYEMKFQNAPAICTPLLPWFGDDDYRPIDCGPGEPECFRFWNIEKGSFPMIRYFFEFVATRGQVGKNNTEAGRLAHVRFNEGTTKQGLTGEDVVP